MPNKKKIKELYERAKQLGIEVGSPDELEKDMEEKSFVRDGQTVYAPNDNAYEFYQTLSERDDIVKKQGFDKWYDENLKKKEESKPSSTSSNGVSEKSKNQPSTNFEKRFNEPNKRIKNSDNTYSTHKMASAEVDGKFIAYPTIVETDGNLKELGSKEAIDYALKNKEYKEFDSEEEAQQYAEGGYKKGTGLEEKGSGINFGYKTAAEVPAQPIDNVDALRQKLKLMNERNATTAIRLTEKKQLKASEEALTKANADIDKLAGIVADETQPIEVRKRAQAEAQQISTQSAPALDNYKKKIEMYNGLVSKDAEIVKDLVSKEKAIQAFGKENYNTWLNFSQSLGKGFVEAAAGNAAIFNRLGLSGDTEGGEDYDQEEVRAQTRENLDGIRKIGESFVTQQKPEEYRSLFSGKFSAGKLLDITLESVASTVPTVASGLVTGGAGTAMTGAGMMFNESKDILKEAGLNDEQSEWAALGLSIPLGLFEAYGVDDVVKAINRTGIKKQVALDLGKKFAGKEFTRQQLFEAAKESLGKAIIKEAPVLLKTGLKEASTEVAQGVVNEVAKQGAQEFTGVDTDENQKTSDYLKEQLALRGDDAVGGFLGGGVLQAVGSASTIASTRKEFTPTTYQRALEYKTPELLEDFEAQLKTEVEKGTLSTAQAEEAIKNVQAIQGADALIPSTITDLDSRTEAVNLLIEKGNINAEMEGKDKSLTKPLQTRLSEIDKGLSEIAEGKPAEEEETEEFNPDEPIPVVKTKEGALSILDLEKPIQDELKDLGYKEDAVFQSKEDVFSILENEVKASAPVAEKEDAPDEPKKGGSGMVMVRSIKELKGEVDLMKQGKQTPETLAKIDEFEKEIAEQEKLGLGENEGRTVSADLEPVSETKSAAEKNILSGKDVSKSAVEMGSDQGGISDFTADRIAEEDYKKETVKIEDLIESDPDLADYLDGEEIRDFEGEPFQMEPIVSSKGEVIDGYNRIAQRVSDGESEIIVLKGVEKKSAPKETLKAETSSAIKGLEPTESEGDSLLAEESIKAKIAELERERRIAPVRAKRGEYSKKQITTFIKNYKEQLRELQGKPAKKKNADRTSPFMRQLAKFEKDVDTNNLSHEERVIIDMMGRLDANDYHVKAISDTGKMRQLGVIVKNGVGLNTIVDDYINEHHLPKENESAYTNAILDFLSRTEKPSDFFNKIRERQGKADEAQDIEDNFIGDMTEEDAARIYERLENVYGEDADRLSSDLDQELEQWLLYKSGVSPLGDIFEQIRPHLRKDFFTETIVKYINENGKTNSEGNASPEIEIEGGFIEDDGQKKAREREEKGISDSAAEGLDMLDELFDDSFVFEPKTEYSKPAPDSYDLTEDEYGIFINSAPKTAEAARGIIIKSKARGEVSFSIYEPEILDKLRLFDRSLRVTTEGEVATVKISDMMFDMAMSQSIVMEEGLDLFGNPTERKVVDSKSIFAQDYNAQVDEAEREWKRTKSELDKKKTELARKNASTKDRERILTPLVLAEKTRREELNAILNKRETVKQAEQAQQSLFESKEEYDAVRKLLPGVNAAQISLFVDSSTPKKRLSAKEKEKERLFEKPFDARTTVQKTEAKGYDLTGVYKIQSSSDIAGIMQFLESESQENFFAVHIKEDGTYQVQYISTGAIAQTAVEVGKILLFAKDYGSKKIVLVHNHPSGKLIPSPQDIALTKRISEATESEKITITHVIMDEKTGAYLSMDKNGDYSIEDKYTNIKDENKIKVYKYSTTVVTAPIGTRIESQSDAIKVLHQMRFGVADKFGIAVLSHQNTVQAMYLSGEINAFELSALAARHAGSALIISTNGYQAIGDIRKSLADYGVSVHDVIVYNSNLQNYRSQDNGYVTDVSELNNAQEPNITNGDSIIDIENKFKLLTTEIKNGKTVLRRKMYINNNENWSKLHQKVIKINKYLLKSDHAHLQAEKITVQNSEGVVRENMLAIRITPRKHYYANNHSNNIVSEPGLDDLYKASKAVNAFADKGILGFDEMIEIILKRYGSINENFFGIMKGAYNLAQTINPREGMTPPGEVMTKKYNEFVTTKPKENVFNPEPNLEPTSSRAAVENTMEQDNVPTAESGIIEQSTGDENIGDGEQGNTRGSGNGIRDGVSIDSGERGDKQVSGGQPGDLRSLINSGDNTGGSADSPKRFDATDVRKPAESIAERSDKQVVFEEKLQEQKNAENIHAEIGDLKNISETLPFLMNGQIEDVAQAEQKLLVEGNKGILFANGTGTGKGLMSLGIAKRFIKQGMGEILFVVPDQKLVTKMVREGKMLQIQVNPLTGITDAGTGVSVTTYANFRENENLKKRVFNLVVFDEAHNILENQKGEVGSTTMGMRAITGIGFDAELVEREKVVGPRPHPQEWYNEYQSEADGNRAWTAYHDAIKDNEELIKSNVQDRFDSTKIVLLSATPFAHEKTLVYGDQILYDMGKDKNAFYIQNFGYRMRYNKLTQPDSDVDVSLMQRTFTDNQIKKGLHNIRMLDVPYDYSRDFLLIDSELGDDIDEGVRILTDEFKLGEIVRRAHGGNYSSKLLEGMKARLILPIIQKHIDAGHKIVVFHSYNVATPSHPFGNILEESIRGNDDHGASFRKKIEEFREKYPKYENLNLTGLMNPIQTFQDAPFKDKVLFINGLQTKGKNLQAMDSFNDDNSDKQVIVVNMAAGASGISLHDETGKNQRLLINLGLPVRPVFAIQTEGRIYRTGQASDAMFLYPIINTNFEKQNFSKIGERADATESLALGSIGRNLKDVFIQGYLNPIGESLYEGQGTGGKVNDKSTFNIDNFQFAKSLYFGQQKKNARTKAQEGNDYFATPEPVGLKMVDFADMRIGERALEPSAGHGAIARWFPEDNTVHFVEPSTGLNSKLSLNATQPNKRIHNISFEDLNEVNKFNTIVMNPPFGTAGKLAMEHVKKAFEGHLKEGGRIVALIPEGSSMEKRFADWYASEDAKSAVIRKQIMLPAVTFERAGTQVRTRIVVIDKITDPEVMSKVPPSSSSDLSDIDNINDLFDRLNNVSVAPRIITEPTQEQQKEKVIEYTPNEKGTHATQSTRTDKNGKTVHVVKFVKNMDYDFFLGVKNYVMANEGWYSKFGKQFETFDQFKANDYVNEINKRVAENGVNEPGTIYYHQVKAEEAKAEYLDQLRRNRQDLTMNGMNMFNAVPSAIKWAYHSMASGVKSLPAFLTKNGLKFSQYWTKVWEWAKGLNNNVKSGRALQGFNMLNVRSHRAFKVQLRQIFDGTKHKAEIDLNLGAAIVAMQGLVNSSAIAKQRYEPVLKGLEYLESKVSGMTHPQAYEYYRQMENDSLPTPIIYDYEETGFRSLMQQLQWTIAPVRSLQKDMKKAGAVISEAIDAEMHIELFTAKSKGLLREFMNKVVKSSYKSNPSLIERMAADDVDIVSYGEFIEGKAATPSFGDYMHALHAPERNAYVAEERQKLWDALMAEALEQHVNALTPESKELAQMKIDALNANANPNAVLMADGGSGMTNDEAAQIINALQTQGLLGKYKVYADEFRAKVLKPMQEIMLESGLANQNIVDEWNDRYSNYVPLWVEDYVEETGGLGGHSGLSGSRDAQPAKGSMKGRVNPLLASIEKYRRTVKQAEENKAVQSFAGLIRTYPNKNEYDIQYPKIELKMNENGELVAKFKADQPVPANGFKFYENGKMRYIVFAKRGQLYKSFESFGKGTPDTAFYRALNLFNTWMYSVALRFNPDFALLSNPVRDIETAMLNIGSEIDKSGVRTKIAKYFLPSIGAMYAMERGSQVKDKFTLHADEFIQHGGMTSWGELVAGRTTDEKLESLQKIMSKVDALSDSFWSNPTIHTKEAVSNFFGALGDTTTAIENATRLATYIAARESGASADKAAQIAKNITVNFEKKGTATPYVAPIYWLANAGVQGSTRMLGGLVKSRKVQIAAAIVMAGSYALAVYNLSRCPEGYSTLDEGIKSRYLVIYKNCNEKYYSKIPFAYGWNAIKYYGDAAAMLHLGQKSVSETIVNGLVNTLNAFNPLGYANSPEDLIENVIPTSMQLIYDLNKNETWYGKPVQPENDDKRYGIVKDSKNYWRYPGATETWAIELADEMSKQSGALSDIDAGSIEVSPNTLQYAKDQLGGGALRTVSDAMGIARDASNGTIMERELTKYPLIRVFVGKERANSTQKKMSEMLVNSFTERQTPVQVKQYIYLAGQKAMAIGDIKDQEQVEVAIRALRSDLRTYIKNVGYERLSELGLGDRQEIKDLLQ